MRRLRRVLTWIVVLLVALPLLLASAVLGIANTSSGQRWIEYVVAAATGDQVRLTGLDGRIPDAPRLGRLQIADKNGVYLTIEGAVLDWSPMRLFHGQLAIDQLAARSVKLDRLPEGGSGNGTVALPVRISVGDFRVESLELGAAVAGRPLSLSLAGAGALDSMTSGHGAVTAREMGGAGEYVVAGAVEGGHINATVKISEPPHGLIGGLANLPDIGGIKVDGQFDGPRDAIAGHLLLEAGALHASVEGKLDLVRDAADLTASANAPAMALRPDLGWQSISLTAEAHGPFTRLDASGQCVITSATAGGAKLERATLNLAGNAGTMRLHGEFSGVHLPGDQPDILAAAPIELDATANLAAPDRPVDFTVSHPLLTAKGTLQTASMRRLRMTMSVPDIGPFARFSGVDLRGHAGATLQAEQHGTTTTLAVQGTVGIIGGAGPTPALVGDAARFDLAASIQGQDVTLSHFQFDGGRFTASTSGTFSHGALDLTWATQVPDLASVQPTLTGSADLRGRLGGSQDALTASVDFVGDIGAAGVEPGHVTAHLQADGIPRAPTAHLTAQGMLLGAPLDVDLAADRPAGRLHLAINQTRWKSAFVDGDLTLAPPAATPVGTVRFGMSRLADLDPLLGRSVIGSVTGSLDASADKLTLDVEALGAGAPGLAAIKRASLHATMLDPATQPHGDASFALDGVSAGGIAGSARVTARGSADAIAADLSATVPGLMGAELRLTAAAAIDATARSMTLASLRADWKQQTVLLLAPARVNFAGPVAIDQLRLGLRQAVLAVSGSISPALNLTIGLHNLPADIASVMAPSLAADGTISAEAQVTGSPARPAAKLRVTASGLRLRSGAGRALPPAAITATATLAGTETRLDSRFSAGPSHLSLAGIASIRPEGPIALRASGSLDCAMANPFLAVTGRHVRGRLDLDATIAGTEAAPRVSGTARLGNGELQDYTLGAHIASIEALLRADGQTIRIESFSGRAGEGTLGLDGTVGLEAPMRADLHVTANNARAVASDLMTAVIDANLRLGGDLLGASALSGTLHIRHADVQIPEKMPSSVAVLPVRVAGAKVQAPASPPSSAPPPAVALNVTLDAPQQIFVRGRGLDVELGGQFHIRGTAADPQPDGSLRLRNGTLNVVGQTITFNSGTIGFTGSNLTNPTIELATSPTGSIGATLTVGGSARDPKITLGSAGDLPQDEVLAQLLFHRSVGSLSPFEIAQIAAGLASLSGAVSGFSDPLAGVRSALGLDRLSVGTGASNSPSLEGGRYLRRGVYVGVKQSATGSGTQATVQVDIAKGLKLETTAGTGTTSATGASSGADAASVGITYQFQY